MSQDDRLNTAIGLHEKATSMPGARAGGGPGCGLWGGTAVAPQWNSEAWYFLVPMFGHPFLPLFEDLRRTHTGWVLKWIDAELSAEQQ